MAHYVPVAYPGSQEHDRWLKINFGFNPPKRFSAATALMKLIEDFKDEADNRNNARIFLASSEQINVFEKLMQSNAQVFSDSDDVPPLGDLTNYYRIESINKIMDNLQEVRALYLEAGKNG